MESGKQMEEGQRKNSQADGRGCSEANLLRSSTSEIFRREAREISMEGRTYLDTKLMGLWKVCTMVWV